MLSLDFESFLDSVDRLDPDKSLLIFVAEQSQDELPKILALLSTRGFTVAGAVFPRVLYEQESYPRGIVVVEIEPSIEPLLIENIDQGNYGFENLPLGSESQKGGSILILVDSECSCLTGFLSCLYQHFGESWNYVGGGAGNHESEPAPCVFTSAAGIKSGAAVIIFIEGEANIDARHGWSRIIGPYIATKSDANLLQEIDWRPALEVYSEVISSTMNECVTDESLRTLGLAYPIGMIKHGAEDVVRVPVAADNDGALVVIGGIPENSVFHILDGEASDIVLAASETAKSCSEKLNRKASLKVVFDCVSRREFLASNFANELEAIKTGLDPLGDSPVIGVLARGEIATTGGRPNWLNKTTVIGVFE